MLLGGFLAFPVQAEEEAGAKPRKTQPAADPTRLTFQDVFGGGRRFTKPIPRWSWRPGHKQLIRLDMRVPIGEGGKGTAGEQLAEAKRKAAGKQAKPKRPKPRPILVTMDPETGETTDLFDLASVDTLVPDQVKDATGKWTKKKVMRMRGIGRAGPPRYRFSKDGKALCVVVRGDLVWVDLEAGTSRRLTHTEAPMADLNIAPDASHVSFSRENELWVVSTTEGKPYPLTTGGSDTLLNGTLDWVYPEELGYRTAAWWSPDSKHIAYLQMDQTDVPTHRLPATTGMRGEGRVMRYPRAGDKNPKVRVGVVPVGGGPTKWYATTPYSWGKKVELDLVVGVEWVHGEGWTDSPIVTLANRSQSKHIEVIGGAERISAGQGWLEPVRSRFVAPRARLKRFGSGMAQWFINTGDFAPAKRGPLTPPGVDASRVLHVDPETHRCVYQGIPAGSHTQGVFLGGYRAKELVRAPFAKDPFLWTSASIDESGTYALVTTQSATTPPKTVLARVKDGTVLREIGDARTKALDDIDLAVPEYGQIPVSGGKDGKPLGHIRWRLWKPKDFDPSKRYGLIVHTYGGPGSRMVRNTYGRGPLLPTYMAQKGFLVLQADGRGTSGQSDPWMFSVQGKLGVLEVDDQATAVKHILKRGYVDPGRVGIWGWSYGGTMACNALTMRGDVFKAGVAVAPVTDWRLYDTIYTERYMGLPKYNPEGYKQSSSITHASKLEGHLLLMHGLGDDNVHVQNSMLLAEAFLKHKKTTWDMKLYAKRGHGIGGAGHDVFRRLVDWFDTHIGEKKAAEKR